MAKPVESRFPKQIFVALDRRSDAVEDLLAYRGEASAVDDDGPTQVASYRLVGVRTLRKKVVLAVDSNG